MERSETCQCDCEKPCEEAAVDLGDILLYRVLAFAAQVHIDQFDKLGEPYIAHVARVVAKVDLPEEKLVAALHDVLEDSKFSSEDLVELNLPDEVIEALVAMTREEGEKYADYLARIKKNSLALRVKLADIEDNTDPKRAFKPKKDYSSLMRRYKRAKNFLTGKTERF